MRFSFLIASLVLIAAPAQAQTLPSHNEALKDLSAHGLSGIRCDSFVVFSRESKEISQTIGAWVDGYVRGVGLALYTTMQDPGRTVLAEMKEKSPEEPDSTTTLAAAMIGSIRGLPAIIDPSPSMATRQSQLSDYCQRHASEHVIDAAGSLLMSWLVLPRKK